MSFADRSELDALLRNANSRLLAANDESTGRLSAELNGLARLYGGSLQANSSTVRDLHYLIGSDTYQGRGVAELLAALLVKRGLAAEAIPIPDLVTGDFATFRFGVGNLMKWVGETLPGYRDGGYRVIFNLTGGFKSVQGLLQTVGTFHADEIVYIFEGSDQLLRIPRLPVRIDAREQIEQHLSTFRHLGLGEERKSTECEGISEVLLDQVDDMVRLSGWGELIWDQVRRDLYRSRLLPPPTSRVRYGRKFEQEVRDLSPDRIAIVNGRIDDLMRYIESGRTWNPLSLSVKDIRGRRIGPSTHEIYAWSDQNAARMFCHFETDAVVIDSLGGHL